MGVGKDERREGGDCASSDGNRGVSQLPLNVLAFERPRMTRKDESGTKDPLHKHETVAKADECESAALRAFRVESLKNMCRIPAANGIRRLSFRPPQGVAYSHVQG